VAHFGQNSKPVNLIQLSAGQQLTVQLWGEGSGGESLDVVTTDPSVFTVEEVPASFGPHLRQFTVSGSGQGSARLQARLAAGGLVLADARVLVDRRALYRYYHGTSSAIADLLMTTDLTPMFLASVMGARLVAMDWTDYTDFGKGFYVHLEENKVMAYEWAKRRFLTDWAVVEFIATADELQPIWPTALHFRDKADRPANSPRPVTVTTSSVSVNLCPLPQILPCVTMTEERTTVTPSARTMSWLEFVEHNRHIDRRGALIARPNDRDWTAVYSRIRGPIWVPRDSGFDVGLPVFPDHVHQLNWGRAGMAILNRDELKARRYKFSSQNESIFPPPR
jgi:hypothetical protein